VRARPPLLCFVSLGLGGHEALKQTR
jgi:hypothetical protein